jgi:hypothetical protein
MDTTMQTLKAFQAQREHNEALSEVEINAAYDEGIKGLADAIKRGEQIFVMDEGAPNELQNAYARGWNTAWFVASKKPVKVVLPGVNDPEGFAALQAMNTGHPGSIVSE